MSSSKQVQVLRQRAFERQGGKCYYCSVAMWFTSPVELAGGSAKRSTCARLRCTAEHLIPRCEGGPNTSENIVAACAHCNVTRHKRKRPPAPSEYRDQVVRRVRRGTWHHRWVYERGLLMSAG